MFEDVIGNDQIKLPLERSIFTSRMRGRPLPHLILTAPGGTGKTFWLKRICQEMGAFCFETQGSRMQKASDIRRILLDAAAAAKQAGRHLFLIVDEIQEIPRKHQQELYYPMIEWRILTARDGSKSIPLSPFTLAAATTDPQKLDKKSFLDRFKYHYELMPLSQSDLATVVSKAFYQEGVSISGDEALAIAERSHGSPRLALRYCGTVVELVLHARRVGVTKEDVVAAFASIGVDEKGLEPLHRRYLQVLSSAGRPVGLETIGSILDINPDIVRTSIEPLLLRMGLVVKSAAGRELTMEGSKHVGALMQNPVDGPS